MTDYQLYHYNMTPEEFQVWQNFVEEIREKCENANLTEIARDVINKRLSSAFHMPSPRACYRLYKG